MYQEPGYTNLMLTRVQHPKSKLNMLTSTILTSSCYSLILCSKSTEKEEY